MKERLVEVFVTEKTRNRIKKEKREMTYEEFLQKLLNHHKKCGVFS